MIKDLALSAERNLETSADVCVIGAGAAGITLALEFERLGIKTVLLEGGGTDFPTAEEQDLYDARTGEKSYPVSASRLRYLGGSTNHWGGWSRCLDDFDLRDKPHFEIPGWPISKTELMTFYPQAAEICQINNLTESENGFYDQNLGNALYNWGDSGFTNKFFVFSPPTRFGSHYQPALKLSEHVTTWLHANATQLIFNGSHITGVRAASLNGHQLTVTARHTILAMGGLENPRFMLHNQTDQFSNGVGNHADWLGRCFMDHPGFRPIRLLLPEGLKYKRFSHNDQPVMPVISMTDEHLMQHGLNNFCVMLRQIQHAETVNREYAQNPWFDQQQGYVNYDAQFILEPSPNPDSRVTLTDETDRLGLRKLKLDWRFNEQDFKSVEHVIGQLIRHLGGTGTGRIQWHKFFEPEHIAQMGGGMHHGGTTRMSAAAEDGVVDEHCQVHGTRGLYVAGNSVFSHTGFTNPTLTIVALALRLAGHIKGQLS